MMFMNELYSACIIHKRKDSFESLYLQYFLEFIEIGVFNYSFDNTSEENTGLLIAKLWTSLVLKSKS